MANELDGSEKNKETERVLLDVISVLVDGQKGFADIGEHLKDETLKRYFLAESLKRANFRAELENELWRSGMPDVKESGTTGGTVHRVWGDLKAHLGGGSDHQLLVTARAGRGCGEGRLQEGAGARSSAADPSTAQHAAGACDDLARLCAQSPRRAGGQVALSNKVAE